jgi:hypothetical protein
VNEDRCPSCGEEGGCDDTYDCLIDPTPQHQWEVTTPAAVHATGLESEEWLP